MKVINAAGFEIEVFENGKWQKLEDYIKDYRECIDSISVEQPPGSLTKYATISTNVAKGAFADNCSFFDTYNKIRIYYANYPIFEGELISTGAAFPKNYIERMRLHYKSLPLQKTIGSSIYILGDRKKREIFDRLTYKIAKSWSFLRAVEIRYPNEACFIYTDVSTNTPKKECLEYQPFVKTAILTPYGFCIPDFTPALCPGSGETATAYGFAAYRFENAQKKLSAFEAELFHEKDTELLFTQKELLLKDILQKVFGEDFAYITSTDFLLWEDLKLTAGQKAVETISDIIRGIPSVVWLDDDILQIWLDFPQKQIVFNIPADAVFSFEMEGTSSLPSLFVYEEEMPQRPTDAYTTNNVYIPSAFEELSYYHGSIQIPDGTATSKRIGSKFLKPKNAEEFLDQAVRILKKTSGNKRGRLKTVLLPTVKPYVQVYIDGFDFYVVEGYRHTISKEGAFSELFVRSTL